MAVGGRTIKIGVAVCVAALVIWALSAGALDVLTDGDRLEELLDDAGVWGPILFVLAFTAAQPLSLPGVVLIVPATFVWPWWQVALLSLAGGMIASIVGFVLARWIARDWVLERLPQRFRTWEVRLAENGFVATVGLRLLTGYTPAADWLLGVSRVTVPAFLAGTLIGLIPSTVALSAWGDDAVRLVQRAPLVLGGLGLAAGAIVLLLRRRRPRPPASVG
jgi:uncharacterized membrane protein YdjX (TVP38/TMEM64 family)